MSSRPILIILLALAAALALILALLRTVGAPSAPSLQPPASARDARAEDGVRTSLAAGTVPAQERALVPEAAAEVPVAPVASDAAHDAGAVEPAASAEAVLRGICRDGETRAPIANALVLLGGRGARSGEDGAFEVAWGGRQQERFLTVQHADFVELRMRVELEETLAAASAPIEVHLRRGVPLVLEVLDSVTGSPVADARLYGQERDHPLAESDARGRLALRVLAGSTFECALDADGHCGVTWSWRVALEQLGERNVLPLVPAAWIEGTVVDGAGQGIVAAKLQAIPQRLVSRAYTSSVGGRWGKALVPGTVAFEMPNGRVSGETDEAGDYRLAVPPSSMPYSLLASRRDFVPRGVDGLVLDAPEQQRRADIVLSEGATIEGTVVRNDEPWDGELRWSRVGETRERSVPVRDGRYRIGEVEAGAIRLAVRSELSGETVAEEVVDVAPGASQRQDFAWHDEVATIAGRVVRAGGAAVAQVRVNARGTSGGRTRFSTRSAADGSFTLEVPPEQTFDITVQDGVLRASLAAVRSGAGDVTLVLADMGELELEIVDASTGSPVTTDDQRFLFAARSGGDGFELVRARLSGAGRTTLTLPVGRVDLIVELTDQGYARKLLSNVLVGERGDTLRVALEPGVDVRFALGVRNARQLRRHVVFLLEETQRDLVRGPFAAAAGQHNTRINGLRMWVGGGVSAKQALTFDREGKARLEGLVPGRYVLRCFPEDVRLEPSTLVLSEPGVTEVVLELERR